MQIHSPSSKPQHSKLRKTAEAYKRAKAEFHPVEKRYEDKFSKASTWASRATIGSFVGGAAYTAVGLASLLKPNLVSAPMLGMALGYSSAMVGGVAGAAVNHVGEVLARRSLREVTQDLSQAAGDYQISRNQYFEALVDRVKMHGEESDLKALASHHGSWEELLREEARLMSLGQKHSLATRKKLERTREALRESLADVVRLEENSRSKSPRISANVKLPVLKGSELGQAQERYKKLEAEFSPLTELVVPSGDIRTGTCGRELVVGPSSVQRSSLRFFMQFSFHLCLGFLGGGLGFSDFALGWVDDSMRSGRSRVQQWRVGCRFSGKQFQR